MHNIQRAAIYCSHPYKNDNVIATQEKTLRSFAKDRRFEVVSVFVDNGSNECDLRRPAFTELTKFIENGEVDVMLVHDISRISQKSIEVSRWMFHWFKGKGVKLISADGLESYG